MSSFNPRNKGVALPAAPYPPLLSARPDPSSFTGTSSSTTRLSAMDLHGGDASSTRGTPTAASINNNSNYNYNISATTVNTTSAVTPIKAPRVQFCEWDVLGCINCQDDHNNNTPTATASAAASPAIVSPRKMGPCLLEWRRLQFHPGETATSLFQTTTSLCKSRGNPALGISVSSTCLDVAVEGGHTATASPPLVATGLTTGGLCVHSINEEYTKASIDYYQMPRVHRPSTAVAWGGGGSHVAIGLMGSESESRQTPRGGLTAARSGGSGSSGNAGLANNSADRDYCCLVWDVEHQSSSSAVSPQQSRRTKTMPLYKLSHQTGVASLAWILGGYSTLILGGQQRNFHLYDLRTKTSGSVAVPPPVAVYAHNFGVHGIEADPNRPHILATYSKAAGEVVKLWDIRRLESSLTEIKIPSASSPVASTHDGSHSLSSMPTPAMVSGVKWSAMEPGLLSIVVGNSVHGYDALAAGSRPTHVNTIRNPSQIVDFCHYPFPSTDSGQSSQDSSLDRERRISEELFSKRMIIVDNERHVRDFATHRIAPLAVSRRTGQIIHGLGRTLWSGSTSSGTSAMERPMIESNEDVSATMMRRARCLHVAKYAMKTASNIELLTVEASHLEAEPASATLERDQLLRLWRWVQRTESLCNDTGMEETCGDSSVFPAKSLVDAGPLKLLEMYEDQSDVEMYSESLYCKVYDSEGRRAARTSCGWTGRFDLETVMSDCEKGVEFERSAALAVWHGDIGAAVDALQRGAEYHASKKTPYSETLELVSLCIAGYRGEDDESGSSLVWRKACSKLLLRADLGSGSRMPNGAGYLRHILQFLVKIGIDESYEDVLSDASLGLCDRVAFACRFLSGVDLHLFLNTCISNCESTGNIEGLAITGIEKRGILILQIYVDRTADVQTAALITGRVVLPSDWTAERRIALEWLHSYRSLLNRWQMWQSRAMFDVDRAELLRKVKMRLGDTSGSKNSGRRLPPGRRPGIRSSDPDVQASVPAQLDARCNYCSAQLGLRKRDNHVNQSLSKMKDVMPCCPQCRKPLPRCAICMLSLGALNPYTELTKDRSRMGVQQGPDDLSSMANLPFAEWFTWCMRCKHGGHAHHIMGWFAKHSVCPVSGCDCQCQFDGIHKLQRPATAMLPKSSEPKEK